MPFLRRLLSCVVILSFVTSWVLQSSPLLAAQDSPLSLPEPGKMLSLSPKFMPAYIKGISIYPDDPFKFDFIIDTGNTYFDNRQFNAESGKLIKYFMAALTVPEKEDWVNLSPYEKDRIIPESLGLTEMGRDMLAQDYILKQLTSSLIYPENGIGKEFWNKVYAQAEKQFGTTNIPMNTFNKVWIVPSQAVVWEHGNSAYVVRSHLKVMLEQDYLSLDKHFKVPNAAASNVVREVVLPALEKEVNEGANFASLRQVFDAMILATWYKQDLRQSLLGQVYANKNKVTGIDLSDRQIKQKIYERYLEAYKKGVYNFIKEDTDPATHQPVARKYFSGGTDFAALARMEPREKLTGPLDIQGQDVQDSVIGATGTVHKVTVDLAMANGEGDVKRPDIKRIAVLTGGGLATGHNSLITAAVREAKAQGGGVEILGIPNGWAGLTDADLKSQIRPLTVEGMERFESDGGSVIKSSRTNPVKVSDDDLNAVPAAAREQVRLGLVGRKVETLIKTLKELNIDGLIVMGGDDTNGVSSIIHAYAPDYPILGVPKTMDNDVYLPGGAPTYGYDSFISAAARNLRNFLVSARDQNRIFVVETFGRDAGFTAIGAGARAGATLTLIPEHGKIDIDQLVERVRAFYMKNRYALIVVSEGVEFEQSKSASGAVDAFGHQKLEGAGQALAQILSSRLKDIKGLTVSNAEKLGYATREAPISLEDSMITRSLGREAVRLLRNGVTGRILYTDSNYRVKQMTFPDAEGVVSYLDNDGVERKMNISQLRGDGPQVSADARRKIGGRVAHVEAGEVDHDAYVAGNQAIFGGRSLVTRIELELSRIDKEMAFDIARMPQLLALSTELKQLDYDIQGLDPTPARDRLVQRASEIRARLSGLIKTEAVRMSAGQADPAQVSSDKFTKGGIDLDAALLDLQVKRDDNGIPLPISSQPFKDEDIHGLRPVIIRDVVIDLPSLLGMDKLQSAS